MDMIVRKPNALFSWQENEGKENKIVSLVSYLALVLILELRIFLKA